MIIPIILAGGTGSRLWPLSREAYPKQFIDFQEGKSLFQQTVLRALACCNQEKPIIVGNEQHRFLIAEQIRQLGIEHSKIILEPCFRGTAPAVALAAMQALNQDKDAVIMILPSDHVVEEDAGFERTIKAGLPHALKGKLVTFGVDPSRPETGYGYIEKGEALQGGHEILRFVEKPNITRAMQYCESGRFYWNSGMFLFSAASFLQELMLCSPEIYEYTKQAFIKAKQDVDFLRPSQEFELSPVDSLDYAVMEKTHNGVVVPLESAWSDVGAWDAWVNLFEKDSQGNVCEGDVMIEDTQNTFIQAKHRLVGAIGIKDLVIIETGDVVLVLNPAYAQSIKPVVAKLKAAHRKEGVYHRKVDRPWGSFESIDQGERFQVKRITVAVGGRLSLQRHQHRSEHWVVVQGLAKVTRGEDSFLLSENQSTYIPMGVKHRLENAGNTPLEMIEVQSGDYLGEDDIERLEDHYGRALFPL